MSHINKVESIGMTTINTIKHIFLTNQPINRPPKPNQTLQERYLLMAMLTKSVVRSLTDRGIELYLLLFPFAIVLML